MSDGPGYAGRAGAVLELIDVTRTFKQGAITLRIFREANLAVQAGEIIALVGPSGAGKSSLLHIAGLLEAPDSGEVVIGERRCSALGERDRTLIRRLEIGFIYQFHHLLADFTALENVILPQMIAGIGKGQAEDRASNLLARLGLGHRLHHRPAELSGGEQQRVAIGRALANGPRLLLADEPTGNLDPKTAAQVYAELVGLVREHNLTAVIATHNLELAEHMDRIVRLEDGQLIGQA
jgi:lipoprotein-releasing system ATP-binding protein